MPSVPRHTSLGKIATACFVVLLTACSGGGSGSGNTQGSGHGLGVIPNVAIQSPAQTVVMTPTTAPPIVAPSSSRSAVPVRLTYILPAATSTSSGKQSLTSRRLQYVSPSNTLISITVTPLGGAGTTLPSTTCNSGSCVVNFTATPGPNTIAFALIDGSGNALSNFSTTTIVQPSVLTTLNFTANPVVDSVTMALASPALNAGVAATDLLTVNAKDKDGNTIVGPGNYVDANGKAISLLLNVTNSQAGGNGNASLLGPARITGPSQAATYLLYDGKWLDHATVSVTSTSPINGTLGSTTFTATPKIYEYGGLSGASSIDELALGPDGNIWFCERTVNKIGRITPQGVVSEFSTGLNPSASVMAITSGPDGNMWFSEPGTHKIGKITMSGTITEYAPVITGVPGALTTGSDGNIWITESGYKVARMTVQGTAVEYAAGIGSFGGFRYIVAGPDGNVWAAQQGGAVDRIAPNGTIAEATPSQGESITVGPDGNLWSASYEGNSIYKTTPSLSVTAYPMTRRPVGITQGIDGNLWVAEQNGTIDRVTTSGSATFYSNGLSAGASPYAITLGSDGNPWFLEPGISKIGKIVL